MILYSEYFTLLNIQLRKVMMRGLAAIEMEQWKEDLAVILEARKRRGNKARLRGIVWAMTDLRNAKCIHFRSCSFSWEAWRFSFPVIILCCLITFRYSAHKRRHVFVWKCFRVVWYPRMSTIKRSLPWSSYISSIELQQSGCQLVVGLSCKKYLSGLVTHVRGAI